MLFIPLPFVVALILLVLLARMVSEGGRTAVLRPFFFLTGGYALLSTIIGLRWGYGMTELVPVMAVLATALSPLAWLSFKGLSSHHGNGPFDLVHALPAILIAILMAFSPQMVDWFLVATFLVYGLALLQLAARGADALDRVPLENEVLVHRALIVTGLMLILSAAVDAFIAIDFATAGGIHAAAYVTVANLLGLFILGIAAATAGRSIPAEHPEDGIELPASQPSVEDMEVASRVEALVVEKQLFRDPDLTLNRLSRKAMIPARRISVAINRAREQSVSQYINGHRIAAACRLLAETDRSITAVMLEAGFQTKSNFNREFRKLTGTNPADWRAKNRELSTSSSQS